MHGRLIQNNMIYYSHVNEDNRIEKELLETAGCKVAVAVAGSGERVIALMSAESCKEIHALDVNEEALFLLELKLIALAHLEIENYHQFTGHHITTKERRKLWFDELKNKFRAPCKKYWDHHLHIIERGLLYAGHFETFFEQGATIGQFIFRKTISGHFLRSQQRVTISFFQMGYVEKAIFI